jgi:hypothetical protein
MEIEHRPDNVLTELSQMMTKATIPQSRYRYTHKIPPPSYAKIMELAEQNFGRGIDQKLLDLLAKFAEILGSQVTLFNRNGEWRKAGKEVYLWMDKVVKASDVREDKKLQWFAKALCHEDDALAAECFGQYLDVEYTPKEWGIFADVFLRKIQNYPNNLGQYKFLAKKTIELLRKAGREKDISAYLKSVAGFN